MSRTGIAQCEIMFYSAWKIDFLGLIWVKRGT